MKQFVLAIIAIAICTPAFAAEYYIVREGKDKKCKIVETKPTDTTIVIVGGKAYVTREEAETQLTVVCND